jgi:hypothetical protein
VFPATDGGMHRARVGLSIRISEAQLDAFMARRG